MDKTKILPKDRTGEEKNVTERVMSRKPLSQLIRETRISLNLSQRTFAKQLDMTQAQLSRLENGTAKKPNRRTLQSLLPYLKDVSYEDLLAMTGYSVDFTDESTIDKDSGLFAEEADGLAEEIKNIKPELYEASKDLYKCLDDPKNLVLLQKIFEMIKMIGISEKYFSDNEVLKQKYLRDCILNILQ